MKNRIKLANEWIQKAENDLKNAKVLLEEGGTIDAVCFHSQQAVEKYLKAFIIYNKLQAKKVHSLATLAMQASAKESKLLDFIKDYKTLDAYYIESRYPPDIQFYSKEEGQEAYNIAVEVTGFIKKLITKEKL